jgi:hypothetical protein
MKKILFIVVILFTCIMSATNIGNPNILKTYNENKEAIKFNQIKQQMRLEKLHKMIDTIEFQSEIKIPNYVDINYIEYMYNKTIEFQLPIRTVFRLVSKESKFIDTIISPVGAKGFFQLMPETEDAYSIILNIDTLNLDYNQKNIYIGLTMLKDLHDYWRTKGYTDKYSWKLTLACYNAGIKNVIKFRGVPPIQETINYIDYILRRHSNSKFYTNIKKNENKIKIGT